MSMFGAIALFIGLATMNIYTRSGSSLIGLISKHGILMVNSPTSCSSPKGSTGSRHRTRGARPLRVLMTAAMVVGLVPLVTAASGAAVASIGSWSLPECRSARCSRCSCCPRSHRAGQDHHAAARSTRARGSPRCRKGRSKGPAKASPVAQA
jgi:hypothetical protein